jgi:hypothetical protein
LSLPALTLFITLPVAAFVLLLCFLLLLPARELRMSGLRARQPNPEPSGASLNRVEQLLADLSPCCWQLPKIAASVLLLLLLLLLVANFDRAKDSESIVGRGLEHPTEC